MGYYCTVPQCTSLAGKTKNVKFHRFPRDVTMADKWNLILKRGKPYTKYSKVCSLHFRQSDYNVTTMGQWKTLSKDAVPSQNLPKLNPDGTVMVIRKSRTVKYRETKKEEGDKSEKWVVFSHTTALTDAVSTNDQQDSNTAYRLQTLSTVASSLPPQPNPNQMVPKPKKQDAFMQTDPIQSEEDDTQPNNSYSETSETSFSSEHLEYPLSYKDPAPYKDDTVPYKENPVAYKDNPVSFKDNPVTYKDNPVYKENSVSYKENPGSYKDNPVYKDDSVPYKDSAAPYKDDSVYKEPISYKETEIYQKQAKYDDKFESPKDYTKQEDYIPQTNEEYNKEAEKYALERKSHNGYDKLDYQKGTIENGYQKLPNIYTGYEKEYPSMGYQNGYPDSVEMLRNQQHNLQMLQEQHRINENQNFFNENSIKQEIDIIEEEKFLYERAKEQLDTSSLYNSHRSVTQQQRLLEQLQHQVKQEPDANACDSVMQPQGSPYYPPNGHNNITGGYYEATVAARPGPELLIAKQNALAAHTQLWQNTMKRPFFYSENPHYTTPQLLHRYSEDITRILQ